MTLKAKNILSSFFRRGMRNTGKSSSPAAEANTAGINAGSSTDMEMSGLPLIDDLRHLCSPSNTGQDSVSNPLAGQVLSALNEQNEEEDSSLTNALEMVRSHFHPRKFHFSSSKQEVRGRLQMDNFKKRQSERVNSLKKGCSRKLGTETTFVVLTKMGKEAGEKEYNAMIRVCIEHARRSNDAEYALDQIGKAVEHLKEMRQLGISVKEEAYKAFFKYLVDMEMVEEFQILKDFVVEASPESVGKLVFYEMLLWIQVDDEEKIQELFDKVEDSGISLSTLQEYYLVALCEKDSKENLQKQLAVIDITKVSSPDVLETIFGYLGKSLLESVAMKLLLKLRECSKDGVKTISDFIVSYATCITNSTVEDVILKINKLHKELDIVPSSTYSEKLVGYLCGSNEVATALDVVENMCEEGLVIPESILDSLLDAIEQILEFNLVQRFYALMSSKNVKPNTETFRRSISLCIRIKDFEGAYNMLGNLKNFDFAPNSTMYNSILAGYFRERKVNRALMVLKEMKDANVKPDSITFSYLINYCDQEEAITEYYKEMKQAGVQANKRVYISLIKAYASCGEFEKAKEVLIDLGVLPHDRNELKSVLISALASNGKITDAFSIYEEMKNSGCPIEPKAILSLIDNSDSSEELSSLVPLAHELYDPKNRVDGFFKIIVFAIRNNKSSSVLDLLNQTKNYLLEDETTVEYWFEEVFRSIAETEPSDVTLGLDLVRFMKEELELCPTRKSLDFLLHGCVNAKDKRKALLVWKEYQFAKLPYNVLNYLRMYQVLVAAGDSTSAKAMVLKIPSNDDRDVQSVINESRIVFTPKKKKVKSKKKRLPPQRKVG